MVKLTKSWATTLAFGISLLIGILYTGVTGSSLSPTQLDLLNLLLLAFLGAGAIGATVSISKKKTN